MAKKKLNCHKNAIFKAVPMRPRFDLLIWLIICWCLTSADAAVERFLKRLGLARYHEIFVAHEIALRDLPSLTKDDLVEMGITAVGPRKRILRAIATLDVSAEQEETCSNKDNRIGLIGIARHGNKMAFRAALQRDTAIEGAATTASW